LVLSGENASFGSRSRVTNPNSQSVISWPPVNHSSVQEKNIVPAAPPFHDSFKMPLEDLGLHQLTFAQRIEAKSPMMTGLSSARFCKRAR
jgi:hypothetical protein